MRATEIRQMSRVDLIERLKQEQQNLETMRFQLASSQLTNTSQIALLRRDIARMKTVLTEWDQRGEQK
jgi:large subunit ribosomal protein L29